MMVKLTGTKHGRGLVEGMVEFFAARREAGGLKLFSTFRWVPPARLLIRQPCRPTLPCSLRL
jgi:hypothetical protein